MVDDLGFVPEKKEDDLGFTASEKSPGLASKALQVGSNILDIPRRAVIQPLAYLAGKATGKDIIGKDAFKGSFPPSEELYNRAGVPEMGSVSIPGNSTTPISYPLNGGVEYGKPVSLPDTKITGRGALGALTDLVASGAGAKLLSKLAYPIYKQGWSNVDAANVAKNGTKGIEEGWQMHPSQVGFEENIRGPIESLKSGSSEAAKDLIGKTEDIYGKMSPIDTGQIPYTKAEQSAMDLYNEPITEQSGSKLIDLLDKYKNRGVKSVEDLRKSKSTLQQMAKKMGAYSVNPNTSIEGPTIGNMASSERQALESGAEAAYPGGGTELKDANKRLGALLGGDVPLNKLQAIEMRKMRLLPTAVDSGVSAALEGSGHSSLPFLVTKKLTDFIRSPRGATNIGIGLKKLGENYSPYSLLNTANKSPWEQLQQGQ